MMGMETDFVYQTYQVTNTFLFYVLVSAWGAYSTAHSRKVSQKKGSRSTAYQAKEYYGVVIGAECLQPAALIPQTPKRDDRGEPLKSKYNSGYWLIDMDPGEKGDDERPTPDRYICKGWKTSRDVLDNMDSREKTFIGAVKKWLHANQVAVWFHSGKTDLCSQFGGHHIHVLYKSTKAPNGACIDPHNTTQYKNIKRACTNAKGGKRKRNYREDTDNEDDSDDDMGERFYFKYEGIKSVEKFIQYCNQPPRLFLGASTKELLQLRRGVVKTTPHDGIEFINTDIWESELAIDDTDDEHEPKRSRRIGRGDLDSDGDDSDDNRKLSNTGPTDTKRQRMENVDAQSDSRMANARREPAFDDDCEEAVEDRNIPPGRGAGHLEGMPDNREPTIIGFDIKQTGMKYDTKSVRIQRMLIRIMHHLYAYDRESISYQIGRLDQRKQGNRALYKCWNRLLAEGVDGYCMKARDQLKPIFQHESFFYICERFAMSKRWKDPQYLSVNASLDLLEDWCHFNSIDWFRFISCVLNVMDRRSIKRNALMVVGPSNGGKSVVVSVPLQTLIPLKCLLSSAGNSGQFLWQDVPGTRCVFMEEADIAPEHMNTAKKILGGEECAVDVKQRHASTVFRVPVIMTCNSDPFYMIPKQVDRVALHNRVFAFSSKTWKALADIDEQANPGMWYKITKACSMPWEGSIAEEEILSCAAIKQIPMPDEIDLELECEDM